MEEFEQPDYRNKLKESLTISSNLLGLHANTFTELETGNNKLHLVLEQISGNGQVWLSLLESLQPQLTAEQNTALVGFAGSHAQTITDLFE
ncbi:MAG: hypothetical protein JWO06_4109, partial [Bacteroidota bacterium]|nr:hypothetical protein [Bacteroidota bacterium]